MPKSYESVEKHEFLLGLSLLEQQGELNKPKEELLHQVVAKTKAAYRDWGKQTSHSHLNEPAKDYRPETRTLRLHMLAAGRAVPVGRSPSYIVPPASAATSARDHASAARAILARWNIPLNHEANGVALRGDEQQGRYSTVYFLNLVSELEASSSRKECIEKLREIGAGGAGD